MSKKYRVILNVWLDIEFCAEWEIDFAIGECGIKLVSYIDEFELAEHMLNIEEV